MPVPITYSESIFADYLAGVLDELGPILGWDASSVAVIEAVNDTLLEYGGSQDAPSIATITGGANIRHLRAFGRRAIWRAVLQGVAGKYDFRDSDATFTRSQIQAMAKVALELAEYECREWDSSYAVSIVSVRRPQDPYQVFPDNVRVP